MKSPVVGHSIRLGGRTTSVALENVFWHSLKEIARRHRMTVTALVEEMNAQRPHSNLSSALRCSFWNSFAAKFRPCGP